MKKRSNTPPPHVHLYSMGTPGESHQICVICGERKIYAVITDRVVQFPDYPNHMKIAYPPFDPPFRHREYWYKCACGSEQFQVFSPKAYSTFVECALCGARAEVNLG